MRYSMGSTSVILCPCTFLYFDSLLSISTLKLTSINYRSAADQPTRQEPREKSFKDTEKVRSIFYPLTSTFLVVVPERGIVRRTERSVLQLGVIVFFFGIIVM